MKLQEVEKKWQKKWAESKIFEAEPENNKQKYFATFPYPYINTSPHLGHAYSFARNDMMIRFHKMLGDNTLFPVGFHATGEPIVGAAKRLKKGDKTQYRAFQLSGVKKEDIENFKNPYNIIKYFYNEFIKDFKSFGVPVDWRRSFHTTSLNPEYNAFVTWQFNTLLDKGLLVKGTHPVIYCPECESPCGAHDRKEGEDATITEYVLLKFKLEKEYLIAATLRPETVFGQTNLWVNPEVTYVKVRVGGETWIVSEPSYKKLNWQKDKLEKIGKVKGSELIGKYVKAPMINNEIIILPASFCKPSVGTGIVTSVPSDAPYDYIALKELQDDKKKTESYGLNYKEVKKIKPVPIIESDELGDEAAVKVCKDNKITSLSQSKALDKATKHVYKIGYHKGRMNKNCGMYAGKKVEIVKDKVAKQMIKNNQAGLFFEASEPVICRCLTNCVIKMLKNQWFIKYSDETWKNKTLKCLDEMNVYPEEARNVMRNMILKMKDKACARKSGLGTPLPCAPECNIECLSDSTIYMSYYIIQKYIKQGKLNVDNMVHEFFDYVLLKKGKVKEVERKTGLKPVLLDEIKSEFEYFYPVDLRNSGKDLLTNHLIFFLYNHTAFWPKKYWPRAIGANGWITIDGEKMSKSKGNFIPMRVAVREYGADASRLAFLDTGEGIADADFSTKAAVNFKNKLTAIIENLKKGYESSNHRTILDTWLISKIQNRIKNTTNAMKNLLNRTALKDCFHGLLNDIYYYTSKRKKPNKQTISYAWNVFAKLNVPFTPHVCEELNELLGNKGFVHEMKYPEFDKRLVNTKVEKEVELLKKVTYDINRISELVGKMPKRVELYVAGTWKYKFTKDFSKEFEKTKKVNDLIKHFMKKDDYKNLGKSVISLINSFVKDPGKIPEEVTSQKTEYDILNNNKNFIQDEFKAEVEVIRAEDSSDSKARIALPGKPGIKIE